MIKTTNISYSIKGKPILQPMSFQAEDGEVTVLLGPNGAGKSTLLRILAGELMPDTGTIWLDNHGLADMSQEQLALKRAVLTQNYSVPLPFTCKEIVAMGRYPHVKSSTAANDNCIIEQCMQEMDVSPFTDRMFNTLSGGEQQRVQMARILAQLNDGNDDHAKILLLDEPTASMDYLQQQLCLSKARELAGKGYTVVVVLHDLNLAAQYADKIMLLKQGYLLAEGRSREVLNSAMIGLTYDMDVDVIMHDDYAFPILVPALHHCNCYTAFNKKINNLKTSDYEHYINESLAE
jgi:iron complex transport system ATP-binding protein